MSVVERLSSSRYANFNFIVEIDGVPSAGFSEVTGLGADVEAIGGLEGGDAASPKVSGRQEFSEIVLRYGMAESPELQRWHSDVVDGKPRRRNGAVVLLDEEKRPIARWRFANALPTRLESSSLGDAGFAIQELVLRCQAIERCR